MNRPGAVSFGGNVHDDGRKHGSEHFLNGIPVHSRVDGRRRFAERIREIFQKLMIIQVINRHAAFARFFLHDGPGQSQRRLQALAEFTGEVSKSSTVGARFIIRD